MAEQGTTGISWTDQTWNPIRGCSRVSEGCRNCYAERVAGRFSGAGLPYEGLVRVSKNGDPQQWNGNIRVVEEHMLDPLRWRKPRRIFVNSMSDLFHENVADETIDRIFAVMALCPQHTFQVLTKRPARMRKYLCDETLRVTPNHALAASTFERIAHTCLSIAPSHPNLDKALDWPLPNVWLGVSAEDQKTVNERIPHLLNSPAAVRWVSAEPLLAPISFRWAMWLPLNKPGLTDHLDGLRRLDWIVVGGESGAESRPMDSQWARSIRDECAAAGVAFHFKQMGGRRSHNDEPIPEDLDIREYPRTKR